MSQKYDPSKQVLERLKSRENKRDWSVLDKSYGNPGITRQWSAESNRGLEETQRGWMNLPYRKPHSPQYLPRLDGAVSYAETNHNLRHGKMKIVPPVRARINETFPDHRTSTHPNHGRYDGKVPDHRPEHEVNPSAARYPTGVMVAPRFNEVQGHAPTHPPAMYSMPMVPMYPGYGPVIVPHIMPEYGYCGEWRGYKRNDRPLHHLTRKEAAVIIQKYFRGWQVRQGTRFAPFRSMCSWQFASLFIESFIEEILREDLIPDVLIEAFSHKKYMSTRDPQYQASESVCQDIIHQDVAMLINETAVGVFYVHTQLPAQLPTNDPLYQVCDDLIHESVQQTTRELVYATINGLVQCHMTVSKSGGWLDNLITETIQPIVCLVAHEAVQNHTIESVFDEIMGEVVAPIQQAVVVETWRETIEASRDLEVAKVRKYAKEHLLDGLCLQYLLDQLVGNNLSLYFKAYTDQVMDGMICGVLSQQLLAVADEKDETLANSILKEYHQIVFSDVALDVLLEELSANLDEDIQDLLELEKEKHRFQL